MLGALCHRGCRGMSEPFGDDPSELFSDDMSGQSGDDTSGSFSDNMSEPFSDVDRDRRTMDDTFTVSVMSFSGTELCTVPVLGRSCVWDLKCSIAQTFPHLQLHQRWMTLMNGPHILANATSVHDAGITNGAVLTVIRTEPHKILVARGHVAEVWNHEGRPDAVLGRHEDAITHVQFSPDTNLAITCCSSHGIAKLWEVAPPAPRW